MKTKDLSWFVAALLLGGFAFVLAGVAAGFSVDVETLAATKMTCLGFALVWCSLVVDNFSSYHTFTK